MLEINSASLQFEGNQLDPTIVISNKSVLTPLSFQQGRVQLEEMKAQQLTATLILAAPMLTPATMPPLNNECVLFYNTIERAASASAWGSGSASSFSGSPARRPRTGVTSTQLHFTCTITGGQNRLKDGIPTRPTCPHVRPMLLPCSL
jgi:hypothetical protein